MKKRLTGLSPRTARVVERLATAIGRRDLTAASNALVGAVASAPQHPEVLRLQGVLQQLQGRPADAVATLRQALHKWPDDPVILNNLGSALRASGDMDGALRAYAEVTEKAPELAAGWYNLGKTLKVLARIEEAREALGRALKAEPGHVAARVVLADTLKALGDIEGAAAAYRQVLRADPGRGRAWFGLANLKTVPFTSGETAELAQQLENPARAGEDRVFMGFAYAKALEDSTRYAEAFVALEMANARKRRLLDWNAQECSRRIDAIDEAFRVAPARAETGAQGKEVILVVSLPRSGSTLVEQILSAHPEVEGASELPDLPAVIEQESRRRNRPFPEWAHHADARDWQRLGEDYLRRTRRWRQQRPRFTDKGLDNWQLVGAAMTMLPEARVVVCRRDPLETCLACFRQLFSSGQAFSYSIDDVVAYWRDFDRLCRLWLAQFPDRVHEITHESLLADPEHTIRELLAACSLPFDEACLTPHQSRRVVRTASAAQVRQPLRQDTRRAPLYGDSLDGLRSALQQVHAVTGH